MDFEDPVHEMNVLYETVLNLYSKIGEYSIRRNNLWIKNLAIKLKLSYDKLQLHSDYFNRNYRAIMNIFD